MSGERHDCAGRDVRGYPCSLGGKFHEEGRWRCHHHAPSKIAERRAKADKRYADKWKAIEANEQRAENKIRNEALEAAAKRIEHYRDVVIRSAGKGTESGAYNVAATVVRDLRKP